MTIDIEVRGVEKAVPAFLPYEGCEWVEAFVDCPQCGQTCEPESACEPARPLRISGQRGRQDIGHDTIKAPAVTHCCRAVIGTIVVRVSTIFGIEEDERVLNGRCRVYG